jgi:N-acetylmuramoyl-L-alanine amidase
MLAAYGYGLTASGDFDVATEGVVTAFQRHFRPARIDGAADASTLATLRNLIATRRTPRRPAT